MPNSELLREGRGRSPSTQRNANRQDRRSKPGSGAAQRDRHREKRRSSASRRKKHRQAKERDLWHTGTTGDPDNDRKSTFDKEVELRTLVEYDDVSSQSERFSGSPSPKLDPHADRLLVDRLSDVDFDYNGPASPDKGHARERDAVSFSKDEQTRGPSERSKLEKELGRKKDRRSRERDSSKARSGGSLSGSKNHRDAARSNDRNGKRTSSSQPSQSADKRDSKSHRSKTRSDKEPPSAYRDAPQSYRDDREDLRAYRRSPGFKAESPYGTSYSYNYQSPGGYNQSISRRSPTYGSKRVSPTSTYYSRDVDVYGAYGMPKSPSSYSSNKRKRSPTSPLNWRRSPSYGRHSPYEQGEFGSSPYGNRRRSRSPYRKSLSPSPDSFPVMVGDMDNAGSLNAQVIHQLTAAVRSKIAIQTQQHKFVNWQCDMEYRGEDFTTAVTLGNPDVLVGSGILVAHYLQSITPALALGGELVYHKRPGEEGAVTSLLGRYTGDNYIATLTLGGAGAHATYYHKANDQLQVGVEFEASTRTQETTASFGYQLDLPKANLLFKGTVDSNWVVGATLEKKLVPLPLTLALGAFLNHRKNKFQCGFSVTIG